MQERVCGRYCVQGAACGYKYGGGTLSGLDIRALISGPDIQATYPGPDNQPGYPGQISRPGDPGLDIWVRYPGRTSRPGYPAWISAGYGCDNMLTERGHGAPCKAPFGGMPTRPHEVARGAPMGPHMERPINFV